VDAVRESLRVQGIEPVIAGASWTLPGEIAFYCAGQPPVYSLGLAQGERHSQYDFWRPNPVEDAEAFLGRTFVYVGEINSFVRDAFDAVDEPQFVIHRERGQPIVGWWVTVCRGYRGFQPLPLAGHY
jgi:hypothetical protein